MLHEFLKDNRLQLIERCESKVAARGALRPQTVPFDHGVPEFLDQLTQMLKRTGAHPKGDKSHDAESDAAEVQLEAAATKHGEELQRNGFTIDQVVHDYGDLCQSITEIAFESGREISVAEFGVMNIKLDNAIASAVTQFTRRREGITAELGSIAFNERLGVLAHEMRNQLNTAILAISAMKAGNVGFGGATAAALDRSLIGMRKLIDRTLTEVRLEVGTGSSRERVEIAPFIVEIQVAAALEAAARGCTLNVFPVEPGIFVDADRSILAAAVANLLQNAFKFTNAGSEVVLRAEATPENVLIEVQDHCGGLPAGTEAKIFWPFDQRGSDRSGLGLGLSISRKAVETNGGTLDVRNLPGHGCVFTVALPRVS